MPLTNTEWKNFLQKAQRRAKYLSNNAATKRLKNQARQAAELLKIELNWLRQHKR